MQLGLPAELIVLGNPVMIETVIYTHARKVRLDSASGRVASPSSPETPYYRVIDIGEDVASPEASALGCVRLQGLPENRTLMTLWAAGGPHEDDSHFIDFCVSLLVEMARLGFIDMADVKKDPIGFRRLEHY